MPLLGMNGYQWTVLFAAWLGWGFDVFDGLLFNYVAPNCRAHAAGTRRAARPRRQRATLNWTGILTSILLVGWAVGGIMFGHVADRIGRTQDAAAHHGACTRSAPRPARSRPTSGCSLLFRIVAGLGIGGEWAAGAAMVAEVVPENRRVEAGALLYTSAPLGLFLATFVTYPDRRAC